MGNLKEREVLEDLDVDGRIILKLIFKKLTGGRGLWLSNEKNCGLI